MARDRPNGSRWSVQLGGFSSGAALAGLRLARVYARSLDDGAGGRDPAVCATQSIWDGTQAGALSEADPEINPWTINGLPLGFRVVLVPSRS